MRRPSSFDRHLFAIVALAAGIVACSSSAFRPAPFVAAPSSLQTLAPAASKPVYLTIELPKGLNNPASPGRSVPPSTFTVGVTASNAAGMAIAPDAATPIVVRVYGPGVVSNPGRAPAPVPSATVGRNGTATFAYSGKYFANAMTVTAVSGTASMTAQLFGLNTPAPAVCAMLTNTTELVTNQNRVLKDGGGFFIQAAVAGYPFQNVQIDTGSTGFYIGKDLVPGMKGMIGPGQPGKETLEPSGAQISGNYYLTPVTIKTLAGSSTTVPMEVLVTSSAGYTSAKYMGVGFGRPSPKPSQPWLKAPVDNVFLQLADIVMGGMHPGYVLTKDRLAIGLNASNANGFTFNGLQPFPNRPGDWKSPPGCVEFSNSGTYQCGSMLLDVGVDIMFVGPSPKRVTSIAIAAPGYSSPATALKYAFPYPVPANATPPAPDPKAGKPVHFENPSTSYVNTGRFALAAASYAYDASCGFVGFKSTK